MEPLFNKVVLERILREYFAVNIAKFLKIPFLSEHLLWLHFNFTKSKSILEMLLGTCSQKQSKYLLGIHTIVVNLACHF